MAIAIVACRGACRAHCGAGRAMLAWPMRGSCRFAGAASAEDAARWLERAAQAATDAQLRRHHRLPANGPRRNVAARAHGRGRPGAGKAAEPRRSGARGRSAAAPKCAATFPTPRSIRIEPRTFRNVFPSLSAEQIAQSRAVLRSRAWSSASAWPGTGRRSCRSSPRTACATGTSSGPTRTPGLLLKARLVDEKRRSRRAVRVHGRRDQRQDRQATWSSRPGRRCPPDWQVKQGGVRRDGAQGHRLVRRQAARRDSRRSRKASARCAASPTRSCNRLFGRPGRRSACSSSRLRARRVADRRVAAGRAQRLRDQERRPPDNRAGRGAARDRAPDRPIGRPALTRCRGSPLVESGLGAG